LHQRILELWRLGAKKKKNEGQANPLHRQKSSPPKTHGTRNQLAGHARKGIKTGPWRALNEETRGSSWIGEQAALDQNWERKISSLRRKPDDRKIQRRENRSLAQIQARVAADHERENGNQLPKQGTRPGAGLNQATAKKHRQKKSSLGGGENPSTSGQRKRARAAHEGKTIGGQNTVRAMQTKTSRSDRRPQEKENELGAQLTDNSWRPKLWRGKSWSNLTQIKGRINKGETWMIIYICPVF
jgi:hypothetical protein